MHVVLQPCWGISEDPETVQSARVLSLPSAEENNTAGRVSSVLRMLLSFRSLWKRRLLPQSSLNAEISDSAPRGWETPSLKEMPGFPSDVFQRYLSVIRLLEKSVLLFLSISSGLTIFCVVTSRL